MNSLSVQQVKDILPFLSCTIYFV